MFNESTRRAGNGSTPEARVTDELATKAHQTVDRLAASARGAEVGLRSHAAEINERARMEEERIRTAVDHGSRRAKAYMRRNPLLGVSAAFTAGVLIASLFLRK